MLLDVDVFFKRTGCFAGHVFDVSLCTFEKMTHDYVHIHAWFLYTIYIFFVKTVLSSLLVVLILSQESSKETTNQPSKRKGHVPLPF